MLHRICDLDLFRQMRAAGVEFFPTLNYGPFGRCLQYLPLGACDHLQLIKQGARLRLDDNEFSFNSAEFSGERSHSHGSFRVCLLHFLI